jgi:hypothetical protein
MSNGWTWEDFGPNASREALVYLDDLLTRWGHPPAYGKSFWKRVQEWQLARGYKGTELGQAADGYLGPTQMRQIKQAPPAPVPPPSHTRIDRTNWKITNPDGTEVKQPEFELYHNVPWFWEDTNGDQVFRAPTSGGQTTSDKTKYFRSENREMEDFGRKLAAWSSDKPRIFRGTLAFTALPHVKQHAVGFQIHDGNTKVIMGRLEERKLFIESPHHEDVVLNTDYRLGTFFDIEVVPLDTGILVTYNGKLHTLDGVTGEDWYYKYGCYCQARAGQEWHGQIVPMDSFAEVRYRAAAVTAA